MIKMLLILSLLPLYCKAQSLDSLYTLNQVINMTYYLYQKIDTAIVGGTGTIISHNNSFYIITAAHVAKQLKNDAMMAIPSKGNKSFIVNFAAISNLHWKYHPSADIALLKLVPPEKEYIERFTNFSFPSNLILKNKENISLDIPLDFLGYPIIDCNVEYFSPLVVRSYPTSGLITNYRYDTKTKSNFFYLDKPSMQGASGGSVYFSIKRDSWYGNKTYMVGIVHGTAGDNTGGKMAAITPSFYIWDLLEK